MQMLKAECMFLIWDASGTRPNASAKLFRDYLQLESL